MIYETIAFCSVFHIFANEISIALKMPFYKQWLHYSVVVFVVVVVLFGNVGKVTSR